MRNSQKGFVAALFLIIIAVLLVGGGTYLYIQENQVKQPASGNTVADTPSTQSTTTQTKTTVSTSASTPKAGFNVVTIKTLTGNPSSFLNEKVQITGKLILIGKNYFTDSRFAVTDGTNQFQVNAWIPLEVAGPTAGQPLTMAGYLNTTVTLQGVVEQNNQGFILKVTNKL